MKKDTAKAQRIKRMAKQYIIYRNQGIKEKLSKLKKTATTHKRSRGGAEQRAMFAKMGASGSLQAKGPSGKRTGPKIESKAKTAMIEKRNDLIKNAGRFSDLQYNLGNLGYRVTGSQKKPGQAGRFGETDNIWEGPHGDRFIIKLEMNKRRSGSRDFSAVPVTTKAHAPRSFSVYKDTNGRPRWVTISSNAFRDKDEEIVSTRALKTAVNRADSKYKALRAKGVTAAKANLKARGPLRWWHVPGLDMGICDFQMVKGRMLIESGTFKSDKIARAMAKNMDLNVSIGFRHPRNEPDNKGVFNNIIIFERSPTPAGRAANNFTSLTVKGADTMTNIDEKIKEMSRIFGEAARDILAGADTTEKAAATTIGDVYGESYKDDAPTRDQLMDLWNAYKEAEADQDVDLDDYDMDTDPWDDEEQKAAKMDYTELKADVTELKAGMNKLMAMLSGKRNEEEEEAAKKEDKTAARIAQLEAEIATLKGDAPRAARGYRASQQGAPIEDSAPDFNTQREKAAQQMGPAGQLYDAATNLTAGLFNR